MDENSDEQINFSESILSTLEGDVSTLDPEQATMDSEVVTKRLVQKIADKQKKVKDGKRQHQHYRAKWFRLILLAHKNKLEDLHYDYLIDKDRQVDHAVDCAACAVFGARTFFPADAMIKAATPGVSVQALHDLECLPRPKPNISRKAERAAEKFAFFFDLRSPVDTLRPQVAKEITPVGGVEYFIWPKPDRSCDAIAIAPRVAYEMAQDRNEIPDIEKAVENLAFFEPAEYETRRKTRPYTAVTKAALAAVSDRKFLKGIAALGKGLSNCIEPIQDLYPDDMFDYITLTGTLEPNSRVMFAHLPEEVVEAKKAMTKRVGKPVKRMTPKKTQRRPLAERMADRRSKEKEEVTPVTSSAGTESSMTPKRSAKKAKKTPTVERDMMIDDENLPTDEPTRVTTDTMPSPRKKKPGFYDLGKLGDELDARLTLFANVVVPKVICEDLINDKSLGTAMKKPLGEFAATCAATPKTEYNGDVGFMEKKMNDALGIFMSQNLMGGAIDRATHLLQSAVQREAERPTDKVPKVKPKKRTAKKKKASDK